MEVTPLDPGATTLAVWLWFQPPTKLELRSRLQLRRQPAEIEFCRGMERRRLQFRTLVRNLHHDFVPQFADLRIQIFQRRLGGFELGSSSWR